MSQMSQLRFALREVFDGLRGGSINANVARSLTYTAGEIIKSCKVELEYAYLRHERPVIEYMEETAAEEAA